MGNRLTKIYTKTGDDGTTGLGDGSRVDKDSTRVEAMGQVDHLNSILGMLIASPDVPIHLSEMISDIQHDLFDLGAELCIPGFTRISETHVLRLESQLDSINENLGRLEDFILPGGGFSASLAHFARTACRNAERVVIRLSREGEEIGEPLRKYLNRLSDFLFVFARELNRCNGLKDVLWIQKKGEVCQKA